MTAALVRYHDWLAGEAIPAGGLAPNEAGRLWTRHIADSLTFAVGLTRLADPPDEALDIGTGVGLPGIPLAIVVPDVAWRLLDRSGRRCRLLRRVVRMLDLPNVTVVQADVAEWSRPMPFIVSRAALPAGALRPWLSRLLTPAGVAVIGGSHVDGGPEPGFELLAIPPTILDHQAWLRIMAKP